MENNKQHYVIIPEQVFMSKDLTANEKILYGYLSVFKKQCCFQSNESLAKIIGVSENTISSALKHLESMGFVFIEFVNGNSAKRRIYTILDNPNKLKYIVEKGYLKSFPQVPKNCEGHKNWVEVPKNCEGQNRGEVPKNCDHIIYKKNNSIEGLDSAMKEPNQTSNKVIGLMVDKTLDSAEYERQFYERNTICI